MGNLCRFCSRRFTRSHYRVLEDTPLPSQQVVTNFGGMPSENRRVPGPPIGASHTAVSEVQIPLVFKRNSLSIGRVDGSKAKWWLAVEFMAKVPCEVRAHFHCREDVHHLTASGMLDFVPADAASPSPFMQRYPAGSHTLRLDDRSPIDLEQRPLMSFWTLSSDHTLLPIVLSLIAEGSQTLMYVALKLEQGSLICVMLKQKVVVQGKEYVLEEVYGLSNANMDAEEAGELCVVCLTDPRTTCVEPCSHFCLCEECATGLLTRDEAKCPICRTQATNTRVFHRQ